MKKNYLVILIILFSGSIFPIDRIDIEVDETNSFGDMCPKEDVKFGHTVVLIDTTAPLSKAQSTIIDRLVLDNRILKKIPPYDRFSILNLNGADIQASETNFIFSKCRPRNGESTSPHKADHGTFWNPERKLKVNWNLFLGSLNNVKDSLDKQPGGNFTQLIEMLKELSRLPDLEFDDSYETRKLIIVSDLVQASESLNLYEECSIVFNRTAKCPSWNKLKEKRSFKNWIRTSLPDFGSYNPEIEIIYLNSNVGPKLNVGILEIWEDFFSDLGISRLKIEVETSNRRFQ